MIWSRLLSLGLLVMLIWVAPSASGAEPRRVLLLHSFNRDFAPFNALSGNLRTELVSRSLEPVDLIEVSLDSARFRETVQEGPLINYLNALCSGRRLDLVIPIGGPAAQFSQRHRQEHFSSTPMLISGADQRFLRQTALTTNDAAVAVQNEPSWIIQNILQLLPQTTNIAVVIGNSPLEQFWIGEIRNAFQPFANQVGFVWLNEFSFAKMLQYCASLPPHSAIFYALLIVDAEGIPHMEKQALTQLHDVANAPLFGLHDTQLGQGIVGGPLMVIKDLSQNTAQVAVRILRGERPGDIRIPPQEPGTPQFDWRELKRWGISETRLPPDRVIKFRQPTFWEQYRWPVAVAVLFCLLQTALIISLLSNRAKRRQGEVAATLIADLSSRFINLPAAMIDTQIKEAQHQVCECLGLDLSALWQWADGTSRYLQLTHLYRPLGGPPTPEPFDSREAFPWCVRQLLDGKKVLVSSLASLPPEAERDRESWQHYGIQSNLTFPLSAGGGELIGALGFNTTRYEHAWPQEIVERLELVAQIFANALARKIADHSLKESEERLSLAADSAEVGFWVLDCPTNVFWVTDRARMIFEFSPDEVIHMARLQESVYPDDWSLVCRSIERCLQGGEPVKVEYRIRLRDGRTRWVGSRGRLQITSVGEPKHLMGISLDITERKQAEEALREIQTTLNAIIDSTNDLIWSVDSHSFGLLTFNRGMRDFFLQQRGIHLAPGMRPQDLFPPGEFVQRWHDLYQRALNEGPFTTEYLVYTGHHVLQLSFNLLKHDDTVFGISVFGKDVTGQRQAEAETHELRSNLTHLTRVNTLSVLSGSLAHELNQPLGIILSNAQAAQELLLQEPKDLAEVQAILSDIVAADRRAGEVITRLRAMLKHGQVSLQSLPLNEVIEEVLRLINADLIGRGVTIVRELAPHLPPVAGDRVQIQQLVLNLVLNGADAMATNAPGTRRLHLRTSLHQDRILTSVRDEGNGLPANVEPLFQPFYTTKPHGLGMGLAICRSIINAHHGRLWAEPHPERGAIFHFELPIADYPL